MEPSVTTFTVTSNKLKTLFSPTLFCDNYSTKFLLLPFRETSYIDFGMMENAVNLPNAKQLTRCLKQTGHTAQDMFFPPWFAGTTMIHQYVFRLGKPFGN